VPCFERDVEAVDEDQMGDRAPALDRREERVQAAGEERRRGARVGDLGRVEDLGDRDVHRFEVRIPAPEFLADGGDGVQGRTGDPSLHADVAPQFHAEEEGGRQEGVVA